MNMKKLDWKNTVELIGIAAIVASLLFVGLQMRQEHVLARADLGSRALETIIGLKLHASDPTFGDTYSKMLDKPSELTDGEMIQINNYLSAVMSLFLRECYLLERDVYVECDYMFKTNAPLFFGSQYAKAWWKKNWQPGPYTPTWMNEEIERLDVDVSRRMLEEIRGEL
jgi:hypothetical protein